MEPEIAKKFFVFQIISFEATAANSHNVQQDTCHWQSMCKQTSLGFHISIRVIFSKLFPLKVTEKIDKSAFIQISQVFGTL